MTVAAASRRCGRLGALAAGLLLAATAAPGRAGVTPAPLDLYTLTPCRAVDTRAATPLQDGVAQTFALAGTCGIPVTAQAVVMQVFVVAPSGAGDLFVYPADASPPAARTTSFPAAINALGNFAIVPLAVSGVAAQVSVAGSGNAHLVIDVSGYLE